MIYLDNAATGRIFKETADFIYKTASEDFFNPSAFYFPAGGLKSRIESTRAKIAAELNVSQSEIYFTSGATEANNWAAACGHKNKKGLVITSSGEHASVHECINGLKGTGAETVFLPLKSDGTVDIGEFESYASKDISFVSVIHVSNETGAKNDIETLVKILKSKNKNAVFHSDGVQAFLKAPLDLKKAGVDLYSISAHKIGGLKGVGALYIRSGISVKPLILGGGQENAMRSGTENTTGILAFEKAVEVYKKARDEKRIENASTAFKEKITCLLDGVKINSVEGAVPDIISLSFKGVKSEVLIRLLSEKNIYIGSGSACSKRLKHNRVLAAMGVGNEYLGGSVRISFPPDISVEDAVSAAEEIAATVKSLKLR